MDNYTIVSKEDVNGVTVHVSPKKGFRIRKNETVTVRFTDDETNLVLNTFDLRGNIGGWARSTRDIGYRDIDIKCEVLQGSKILFTKIVSNNKPLIYIDGKKVG